MELNQIKKIVIINGPNLNLLGTRNTEIYGNVTFEAYFEKLKSKYASIFLQYFQSNDEATIVNKIHDLAADTTSKNQTALIINAGAYSHSSIAIADAISAINIKSIAVHISNIYNREKFRQVDIVGAACSGHIIGLGIDGYDFAIDCIINN